MNALELQGIAAAIDGARILDGVDIVVPDGEIHALMGPNGNGKSTLANLLAGHPRYELLAGSARLYGEEVLALEPQERARKGLFLAFQYPPEIPGVTVAKFLKRAASYRADPPATAGAFIAELKEAMAALGIEPAFANRALNEGFSGGEKKRMELLQLLILRPRLAIFDETDSGLDIDALKVAAAGIARMRKAGSAALVITHYGRLLELVRPDRVHVLEKGRVTASGGMELVEALERGGYGELKTEVAHAR